MKSKILSYNHSQNHHTSTAANGSNSSNRNRNSTKYSNNKYSKIDNNKDNEKDICNNNNNNEEVNIEHYCLSKSERTVIIADSLNNNSTERKNTDSLAESVLEDIQNLNIDSSDFIESQVFSTNGHPCPSNDDDGNDTDHYMEPENTDEDSQKSHESILENKTNLIVNYLPQNMSQEEMRLLFSKIGDVESCKLIRDKTTGQSLSYGFVNYQDSKDANTAIQRCNGLRLQNKMIKVSLARPSSETIKGANLYICGLPKSMSQMELEPLFSQYGTIITCRILSDNVTGNSKGVAFIRFDQRHEAETAIKKLNGHTPPNGTEPITVKLANTPFNINNSSNSQLLSCHNQSSDYCSTSPNNSTPITPSIGGRCMISNMRAMVTTCSDIIPRLDVVLQSNGHPSPGVMGAEYVQSSVSGLTNNHQVHFPSGQMVCPPQMHPLATFPMSYPGMQHPCLQSLAGPQGPTAVQTNSLVPVNSNHPSSQPFLSIDPITASAHILDSNLCCLIVYNLNPETKESSLWQTFGPFGAVHSVNIARDPVTGKCTGFGYVTMPNYHEAILAATQLNGNSIENQFLQIFMNPGLKMPPRNQYVLPSMAP